MDMFENVFDFKGFSVKEKLILIFLKIKSDYSNCINCSIELISKKTGVKKEYTEICIKRFIERGILTFENEIKIYDLKIDTRFRAKLRLV